MPSKTQNRVYELHLSHVSKRPLLRSLPLYKTSIIHDGKVDALEQAIQSEGRTNAWAQLSQPEPSWIDADLIPITAMFSQFGCRDVSVQVLGDDHDKCNLNGPEAVAVHTYVHLLYMHVQEGGVA